MVIPTALLAARVTIEGYLGDGGYGPTWAAPTVDVPARVEGRRRITRDETGREVISAATVYLRPDVTVAVDDRITIDSRTYMVAEVVDAADLHGVSHREVILR